MIETYSRCPGNTRHLIGAAVFGAMVAVAAVGCAYRGLSMATPPAVDQGWKPAASAFSSATLAAPNPTSKVTTYNSNLAPLGAAITAIVIASANGSTTAQLTVAGLLPNRGYAVHAHTKACGATADAAGSHFQNHIDPAATPQAPSSDSALCKPKQ